MGHKPRSEEDMWLMEDARVFFPKGTERRQLYEGDVDSDVSLPVATDDEA